MLQSLLYPALAALVSAGDAAPSPDHIAARHHSREHLVPRAAIASCGALDNEVTFSVNSVDFISQIFKIPVGQSEQQIAFMVTNTASTTGTQCYLSNFMISDTEWSDKGTTWHDCLNQTINGDDNVTYTVLTSTLFDWTQFIATVKQTWACEGESSPASVNASFSAQLALNCESTINDWVNITECSAAGVYATAPVTILA